MPNLIEGSIKCVSVRQFLGGADGKTELYEYQIKPVGNSQGIIGGIQTIISSLPNVFQLGYIYPVTIGVGNLEE